MIIPKDLKLKSNNSIHIHNTEVSGGSAGRKGVGMSGLFPGRPASSTRLHGPHCQTPVPGPSPVTARSHRCDTNYTTALRSPPSVSC